MSENDFNRIEEKVDLLYKILIEKFVDEIGYPYDFNYLSQFLPQLIHLFELTPRKKKELIFPSKKEVDEVKDKLKVLKKKFRSGDYLAKNKEKMDIEIKELEKELEKLNNISNNQEKLKEEFNEIAEYLYLRKVYEDLREKLGLDRVPKQLMHYSWNPKKQRLIAKFEELKKKNLLNF